MSDEYGTGIAGMVNRRLAQLVASNQAQQAADTSSSTDFGDTRVWADEGSHIGSATRGEQVGRDPGRVVATVNDIRRQTMGYAANPSDGRYMTLAENLYRKGALYDMRYATNVNSVMEANDRAIQMYLNSDAAGKMSYAQWLTTKGLNSRDDGAGPGGGGPYGGGGGGSQAFTNSTVQFTTKTDARSIVDNALNQWLGRDATPKERQKFWEKLNKAEAASPQVDSGVAGPGGTSRTVKGGFSSASAGILAEDFAKSRDEYAETQASTTVLDWMTESIMKDQTEGLM